MRYKCPYRSNNRMTFASIPQTKINDDLPWVKIACRNDVGYRGVIPHIRVNAFKGWAPHTNATSRFICISISDYPKVVGEYLIDADVLTKMIKFVKKNKSLLMLAWDNIISADDVIYINEYGFSEWKINFIENFTPEQMNYIERNI